MENAPPLHALKPASPLIYIVDDEPGVLQVLKISLRLAGYETQSFCDPLEAWESFAHAQPKPAVLLSDYKMPGMSGIELIERCKASHPALKTVCISGNLGFSDIEKFATRPDKFISKPFFPQELLAIMKELLQ